MKKTFCIIMLLSFSRLVLGQTNLVPNPSFESYTTCPSAPGQIYKATGWNSFRESPDYYNSCASINVGVPNNSFGSQSAYSGSAYCGIITYYYAGLSREVVGIQLLSPLTISQKYFISFMLNQAGNKSLVRYSTNKIGVRFSTIQQNPVNINNWAHYSTNSTIADTLNWSKISGSFIADSSYNYLMIGNFFDDANTTITDNGGSGVWAYYFIDKICVSTDSLLCDNPISIKEENYNTFSFKAFPNPASDYISFTFSSPSKISKLNLLEKYGQIIMTKTNFSNNKLDITNVSDGLYFIQIIYDGRPYYDKIIVRH